MAATASGLPLAARAAGITGSVIDNSTSLLQNQTRDIVRFAMGSPAPDAIPTEHFAQLLQRLGAEEGVYDYGPSEGERELRDVLLRFLSEQEGNAPGAERLLITAGGMQGLDLAFKLFVEAGDLVVTEAPTYTNGTATITGYEGAPVPIPMDDEGMQVGRIREICEKRGGVPKVIYTVPTFQNPSGTTLSLTRRRELIELAQEWGSVIVEDDPYSLLRFEGEALPSIESIAGDRVRVIGVRTFSKMLAPGLRVGWLTADPPIIELMIAAKQSMDTCTNVPLQRLTAAYVGDGLLDAHLDRMRTVYRERKVDMQGALERHFADLSVRWTDPAGGFFLWLELPEGVDAEELFPVALEEGVAFIPGVAFSPEAGLENALRLCFVTQNAERTDEGIRRLRAAVDRLMA
jgi:2-aminoadipate transaminase